MGYLGGVAGPLSVTSSPEPSIELWVLGTLGVHGWDVQSLGIICVSG